MSSDRIGHGAPPSAAPVVIAERARVQASAVHGRGVFAAVAMGAGEVVEECPIVAVDALSAHADGLLYDHLFAWGAGAGGQELVMLLGLGMLYNHSAAPNLVVTPRPARGAIAFVTTRAVEEGEELTHDYGAGAAARFGASGARRR